MADKSDLRLRGATAIDVSEDAGTAHPYSLSDRSTLQSFSTEIRNVIRDPQAKKILGFAVLNIVCTVILLLWCNVTNSMALTAYTYLTIFDMFSLLTCLVTIWVQQKKPSPVFSFGYERFEVLAVFASTILAQLGSLFIVKESIERMLQQPDIHTGRLLLGTAVAFVFHMFVTYTAKNRAFNNVIAASSSSWLQEHVSDISESVCHVIPGMSKLLLPRINPFALIAFAGATALAFVYLLIDIRSFHAADTWAAVWIALMTVGTMFPMSVYSGKILLQTTPSHMIGQLDKCLREASTLDGVLEFRHEHFWTLAFGNMGGSVHVRVRRDADEQMVLAHVYNRLANLVTVLTVQIFKDDWSRPSAFHILGDSALLSQFSSGAGALSPSTGRSPSPLGGGLYGATTNSVGNSYKTIPRNNSFTNLGAPFYGASSAFSPITVPSRTDTANSMAPMSPTGSSIPAIRLAANAHNIGNNTRAYDLGVTDNHGADHSGVLSSSQLGGAGVLNSAGFSMPGQLPLFGASPAVYNGMGGRMIADSALLEQSTSPLAPGLLPSASARGPASTNSVPSSTFQIGNDVTAKHK